MVIYARNASVPGLEAADCEIGVASDASPCREDDASGETSQPTLEAATGSAAGVVQIEGGADSASEAHAISTRGHCKVSILRWKVLVLPLITLAHFTLLHVHRHASELPV